MSEEEKGGSHQKMEADMINPDDFSCIAFLNKKRKLQDELLGMPLRKHVCWDRHRLACGFPVDSTTEPKMVSDNILVRGVESEPESASHSYSFPGDADMSMSSDDDAKTYLSITKAHASAEAAASSTFSDYSSSQIGPYSSESRSLNKESTRPSICEELHCLYREYGLKLPVDYEAHLLEFGSHGGCSLSGCQVDAIEGCVDEGVDYHLYSNGDSGSNYVLSSGRRSVNEDNQEGTKKLTIDKEFEQYFSALMLCTAIRNVVFYVLDVEILQLQTVIPSWSLLALHMDSNRVFFRHLDCLLGIEWRPSHRMEHLPYSFRQDPPGEEDGSQLRGCLYPEELAPRSY